MGALSEKTVLLVTHQVDFLPAFDSVLVSLSQAFHLCRASWFNFMKLIFAE